MQTHDFEAEADQVLSSAYAHCIADRPIAAAGVLVDLIDSLLTKNALTKVRTILDRLDPEQLSPHVLIGVLSLTWHGKAVLGETRTRLFERVMRALKDKWSLSPERIKQITDRLR